MTTPIKSNPPLRAVRLAAFSALLVFVLAWSAGRAFAGGSWIPLSNRPPKPIEQMFLLSDGTVLAQDATVYSHAWFRLVPDALGSYVNGSWDTLLVPPCAVGRYDYASAVLKDGRVFIVGGEYADSMGGVPAEIYDPVGNNWTSVAVPTNYINPALGQQFSDAPCIILPDGRLLITPINPVANYRTLIFNPSGNSWTYGPTNRGSENEASWVKLPDESVLSIMKIPANVAERLIPSLNLYLPDAVQPVSIYSANSEMGAGVLLASGKALFVGGTGNTVIYTPSGGTNNGSWVQGPSLPNGYVMKDCPAASLMNGKVLLAITPPTDSPIAFCEYDYANGPTGTFTPIASPAGAPLNSAPDNSRMVLLPNGSVLCSFTTNQLFVFQPDGGPQPAWKPSIVSITPNPDGSYHLAGRQLNGLWQGAVFGDDAQMDSNYPLIRFTDGGGHVYYGRTYNWSSTGVQTGAKVVTTEFKLPAVVANNPATPYSLQVVANGIASDAVSLSTIWVDFSYAGALQSGSFSNPFKTLAAGANAAAPGAVIALKTPGSSPENITLTKPTFITATGGPATIGH